MQDRFTIRSFVTYLQASKAQNVKANPGTGSTVELKRTSSSDRTLEEQTVAESVADELVLQSQKNGPSGSTEQQDETSKNKAKDSKGVKAGRSLPEENKVAKAQEEKRSRPQKIMEFHNIKISQVVCSFLPFEIKLCTYHLSSYMLKSC